MNNVTTISRQQLLEIINRRGALVFEALPDDHWAAGHIPGALAMRST